MRRPARPLAPCLAAALLAACTTSDAPPSLEWETFRAGAHREPTGAFVYDGDVVAVDEAALRRAWARHFAKDRRPVEAPAKGWDAATAKRLTYCVSLTFGNRHREVVAALEAAAVDWEAEADVDLVHLPAQDLRCGPTNTDVLFDVAPVFRAPYLARAFGPGAPRPLRQLLVDDGAFDRSVSFVGILRHELGHVLGLSHLSARPESAPCFEASEWSPPFEADAVSAMVYPACDGGGDWELSITDHDREAVRALYGRAPPPPEAPQGTPVASGSLDTGGTALHGPFVVTGGTRVSFGLLGPAGSQALVRFDAHPTPSRAALTIDAGRVGRLQVPVEAHTAWILVVAEEAGDYDLFAPGAAVEAPEPAAPGRWNASGWLLEDEETDLGPFPVQPGRALLVTVNGSSDPDLAVAFDAPASDGDAACVSIEEGPDRCALTVPTGATNAWVRLVAYTTTTYVLDVSVQ